MHASHARLVPLAFGALLLASAVPLSAAPADGALPEGMNALVGVASFAMAHPARFGETPTMIAAREYLVGELAAMGLEVEEQRYTAQTGGTNIVAIKRGTVRPNDWLVMSAHYDSVAQVGGGGGFLETIFGAWDDGAGVAANLELARAASQREWANSMVFAFFDDEEIGLVGSGQFVSHYQGKTWNGAPIRLIGNLNMDPPGLNWPCGVEQGAAFPVVIAQQNTGGAGQVLLRSYLVQAKDDVGVPDWAFQLNSGSGVAAFLILSGSSDHVRFGQRGIPNLYVGGNAHLKTVAAPTTDVPFLYPLHTPADTLGTMLAYCPVLDQGFQVAMDIVWGTMERVDAYPSAFPTP